MLMPKENKLKVKAGPKKALPARIPVELLDRLDAHCDETGYIRNSVVEEALEQYLDREAKSKKK